MKKFISKLHLWVSVPFGIVITITCFTGAMLVLENEITDIFYSDIVKVEPAGQPLTLDVIAEKVKATLPAGAEISGFVLSPESDRAYKVNVSRPRKATLYVNQYTGAVNGEYARLPFFRDMLRLHRWLMDSNPGKGAIFWGKMVVGASTLAFVAILLTGLVIWWPRNRKMLRNRMRVNVRKGKNRFWYDLHVAGGFYAFLLLLAMALTGLTWSYRWYSDGFYSLLGAGDSNAKPLIEDIAQVADVAKTSSGTYSVIDAASGATPSASRPKTVELSGAVAVSGVDALSAATAVSGSVDGTSGATVLSSPVRYSQYTSWGKALACIQSRYPEYSQITVGKGTVSVRLRHVGNQNASDKYTFDTTNGSLKTVQYYRNNPVRSRMRGLVYSIHVGTWGGVVTKLLYFVAALLGASLPLTGYYFWIRRLYNKKQLR